jgi:hypothetical protein
MFECLFTRCSPLPLTGSSTFACPMQPLRRGFQHPHQRASVSERAARGIIMQALRAGVRAVSGQGAMFAARVVSGAVHVHTFLTCSQPLQCGWFCPVASLRCMPKHSTASLPALRCIECGLAALAAHNKIDLSVRLHWTRYISAQHKALHHCIAHMHVSPRVYAALSHTSTCIRMHALLRSAQPSVSTISGSARHMSSAAAKGGGHKNKFKLVATDLDGTFMRDAGLPPWLQVGTVCAICAYMHACATRTVP